MDGLGLAWFGLLRLHSGRDVDEAETGDNLGLDFLEVEERGA